jgi:hypothetical protein
MAGLLCAFEVVKVQAAPPMVWIVDLDLPGRRSVTNDVEAVCTILQRSYPNHRIIYRDSVGNWDELAHDRGWFIGFRPAPDLALEVPA